MLSMEIFFSSDRKRVILEREERLGIEGCSEIFSVKLIMYFSHYTLIALLFGEDFCPDSESNLRQILPI